MHAERIVSLTQQLFRSAKMDLKDIDGIGVTYGPGLIGALLVGITFAQALAFVLKVPLFPVNHLKAHAYGVALENNYAQENIEFPALGLIVSGGHTELVELKSWNKFHLLGKTLDDAAGEVFDKISYHLGLGYPGGPKIEALSAQGDPSSIKFPHPHIKKKIREYDFSFSGIKTSVIYYTKKNKDYNKADVAASFQYTLVEILTQTTLKAARKINPKSVILCGGVAANRLLRKRLKEIIENKLNIRVYFPPVYLCTDNAAMVAGLAYHMKTPINNLFLEPKPELSVNSD
jgi:N6-L-threonylcarbamoyladenine synthase